MQLIPALLFNGDCEEALMFYQKCFGGKITYMERYKDAPAATIPEIGEKILHAKFEFEGNTLYASDAIPGKMVTSGTNQSLTVELDSKEQLSAIYEKISKGASIKTPLQDSFWGTGFAVLTDRHGITWSLNFTRVI